MPFTIDLHPIFTEDECEKFKKMLTDKKFNTIKDNIMCYYEVLKEIDPDRFFRKDLEIFCVHPLNTTTDIRSFLKGCYLAHGKYTSPGTITLYYTNIVYGYFCLRKSGDYRKYRKKYINIDTKSLSLKKAINNFMLEVLVHEMLHGHQYHSRFYNNIRDQYLSSLENSNDAETIVFLVQYYYDLMTRLNYIPCRYFHIIGKALNIIRFYCTSNNRSYIEFLQSKEPKDMELKRKFACQAYQKFGKFAHYKKASLEYLLAVKIIIDEDWDAVEKYHEGVHDLIREMRETIRRSDYFVYEGIVWKENGKYINAVKRKYRRYD